MGIRVLSGGLFTTVQDLGRVGWQQFGFAQSGAMDARALQTANILVGNARGEAGLEIALMGPTIEFTAEGAIALTGADLQPLLGGAPMPMYRAVRVAPGDVLSFQYLQSGCRAYLAFAGGLDVPLVMGSRSTQASCALGGFQGRKLAAGDEIAFRAPAMPPDMARRTAEPAPLGDDPATLRVVLGPQADAFSPRGIRTFLNGEYALTPDFDRMGCRLDGPPIEHAAGADITSDGIANGAIQVPAHGQPIVLLADRQTTGGYAKIATVISADLPIIAQRRAGQAVRFAAVSVDRARNLAIAERRALDRLDRRLNRPGLLGRLRR
ncbi:MAG: biotin-dependent carboxyltransferase family protein [Clostridiales bacterium]|nr:biotin-dependent carboxyltransferase family protein [Clostridiales bacterium]